MNPSPSIRVRKVRSAIVVITFAAFFTLAPPSQAAPGACQFSAETGELSLLEGSPPVTTGRQIDQTPYENFGLRLRDEELHPEDRRLLEQCGAGDATYDDVKSIRVVANVASVQLTLTNTVYPAMKHPTWWIDAAPGVTVASVKVVLSYQTQSKPYVIAPVLATDGQSLDISGDQVPDIKIPALVPWTISIGGPTMSAFGGVVDLRKMNSPAGLRDTLHLSPKSNVLPSTIYGPLSGADMNVVTSNGPDRVTTYGGNDYIDAAGGNDRVESGDGIDSIGLGAGNDFANAGGGHDWILADSSLGSIGDTRRQVGNDIVYGGTGTNYYHLDGGNDQVVGGPGRDLVEYRWSRAKISLGAGDDAVTYDPQRSYYKYDPTVMNGQHINCGAGRADALLVTGMKIGDYRYRKQPGCETYNPRSIPWTVPVHNDGTSLHFECSHLATWCPVKRYGGS